jgi:uncharacterized protein YukE
MADHWSVAAEAGDLAETSAAWGSVLSSHDALIAGWSSGARALLSTRWAGAAANAYAVHRAALEKDLHNCVELAGRVAAALRKSADAVTAAQTALSGHFTVLSGVLDVRATDRGVTFRPRCVSDVDTMRVAVSQAGRVRSELTEVLDRQAKAIAATVEDWDRVARTWRENAEGRPAFASPAEAVGTLVLSTGDAVVISTGSGDDEVRVWADPATGEQIVASGTGRWRFAAGTDLVVRTGSGDDTVVVAPGTHVRLTVIGADATDDDGRSVTVQISDLSRHIRIEGTPEFTERVQADLDLLRSSPTGQSMLTGRDTLTIREYADHNAPGRIDPAHLLPFTENALRSEPAWAPRARYAE